MFFMCRPSYYFNANFKWISRRCANRQTPVDCGCPTRQPPSTKASRRNANRGRPIAIKQPDRQPQCQFRKLFYLSNESITSANDSLKKLWVWFDVLLECLFRTIRRSLQRCLINGHIVKLFRSVYGTRGTNAARRMAVLGFITT